MTNSRSVCEAESDIAFPSCRKKTLIISACWIIIGTLQLTSEDIGTVVRDYSVRFVIGLISFLFAVVFMLSAKRGKANSRKYCQHMLLIGTCMLVFFILSALTVVSGQQVAEFQLEISLLFICILSCIDMPALRVFIYGCLIASFIANQFRNSLPASARSITLNCILFFIYSASSYFQFQDSKRQLQQRLTQIESLSKESERVFQYLPQSAVILDDRMQLTLANRAFKSNFTSYHEDLPETLFSCFEEVTNLKVQDECSDNFTRSRILIQSMESNTKLLMKSRLSSFAPLPSIGKRQSTGSFLIKNSPSSPTRSFADTEKWESTHLNTEDPGSRANFENLRMLVEHMHIRMSIFVQQQLSGDKTNEPEFLYFSGKKGDRTLEISIGYIFYENSYQLLVFLFEVNEKQRAREREQLEKSQMAVIANVAHEFRTPLNGTMLMLEASLKDVRVPMDIKKNFIEVSLRSLQRLMFLINDLLDISQIRAQKIRLYPKPVEVVKLIDDVSKIVSLQASLKGIDFLYNVDADVPKIIVSDENRLQQILINLLGNAIKFTFAGYVEICVRISPKDPSSVEFSVNDTGIGISEANQQKLFQAFEKIDSKRSLNPTGVGLGLVISNSLAQMLGSGIEFTSREGLGSSFFFSVPFNNNSDVASPVLTKKQKSSENLPRLPTLKTSRKSYALLKPINTLEVIPEYKLSSDSLSLPSVEESNNETNQKGNNLLRFQNYYVNNHMSNSLRMTTPPREKTESQRSISSIQSPFSDVLVVDDDPFCVLSLETIIKSNGYSTMVAYNGKRAVEIISGYIESIKKNENRSKTIKLIFIDCEMPLMNGFAASKMIKEMLHDAGMPPIPIIGCSGQSTLCEESVWRSFGMDWYLLKPLSSDAVVDTLCEYMFQNSIEELIA